MSGNGVFDGSTHLRQYLRIRYGGIFIERLLHERPKCRVETQERFNIVPDDVKRDIRRHAVVVRRLDRIPGIEKAIEVRLHLLFFFGRKLRIAIGRFDEQGCDAVILERHPVERYVFVSDAHLGGCYRNVVRLAHLEREEHDACQHGHVGEQRQPLVRGFKIHHRPLLVAQRRYS